MASCGRKRLEPRLPALGQRRIAEENLRFGKSEIAQGERERAAVAHEPPERAGSELAGNEAVAFRAREIKGAVRRIFDDGGRLIARKRPFARPEARHIQRKTRGNRVQIDPSLHPAEKDDVEAHQNGNSGDRTDKIKNIHPAIPWRRILYAVIRLREKRAARA